MNLPFLKSLLLTLLLVPAMVAAVEERPSASPRQHLNADQRPTRSIDWPWKSRVYFDRNLDAVVGTTRELQDY